MLLVKTKIDHSAIHGMGLFADEFIKAGTIVARWEPGLDVELRTCRPDSCAFVKHFGYRVGDTWFVPLDDLRFCNHSFNPNIESSFDSPDDVAIRDIGRGDELTVNYYTFDEAAGEKYVG